MNTDDVPVQPASVRAFIAYEISDEVRENIRRSQIELKKSGAHVSWVDPANIHLTLAFLGDIFVEKIAPLCAALDETAGAIPAFGYDVAGVGYFGTPAAIRVIWAGIPEMPKELKLSHEGVSQILRTQGFTVESRPFKPHLTMGRMRSAFGVRELTSAVASVRNTAFGAVQAQRLLLMRSHLDQPRARYSILHASPLRGA